MSHSIERLLIASTIITMLSGSARPNISTDSFVRSAGSVCTELHSTAYHDSVAVTLLKCCAERSFCPGYLGIKPAPLLHHSYLKT